MPRSQLRQPVKLYRENTGWSNCLTCNSDIWFFFGEKEVISCQHGNDPDDSIVLNTEPDPKKRLKLFSDWLRSLH